MAPRERVSLIKGAVQRVQAAGASDKWMGGKSPVVAALGPAQAPGLLRPVPVLGRGQGSIPGKGRHWAESICWGSSASFRPQLLEVQPRQESRKYPLWHCLSPVERGRDEGGVQGENQKEWLKESLKKYFKSIRNPDTIGKKSQEDPH